MGVTKLLPNVGPLCKVENFFEAARNRVIGVDAHVWLHHFAYACAEDIVARSDFEPLAKMFIQRCQFLLGHGIMLVIVFDGGSMPAKGRTAQQRAQTQARQYARHTFGEQVTLPIQAMRAAVKITDECIKVVISKLRMAGMPYVVAPYEADAQLAWLSEKGHIWAALTVDSDFIVHGVTRTFFKVNYRNGTCFLVDYEELLTPGNWPDSPQFRSSFLQLLSKGKADFLLGYALAVGCDYDTKVSEIGPARAEKALQHILDRNAEGLKGLSSGDNDAVKEVLRLIASEMAELGGDGQQIATFPERALKAVLAFRHPLVYDIARKVVITKDGLDCAAACRDMSFLGAAIDHEDAPKRAAGDLSPDGNQRIDLPPMSVHLAISMPSRLSAAMIDGAVLPREPVRANTVAMLHKWLDTRHGLGDMGLSNANKETLVQAVENRMEVEESIEARGDRVLLRDPAGRSLQAIILELHPEQNWHFLEDTPGRYPLPTEGWISDREQIQREAPLVDAIIWYMHWEHTLRQDGNLGFLDYAWQRVKEMPKLVDFEYHPAPPGQTPYGSRQARCMFRVKVPASMRSASHMVWMEATSTAMRGLRPRVSSFIRARCTCASSLCLIIHSVPHHFLLLPCDLQIEHGARSLDGCSRHRNQPTQIQLLKLLHSSTL